MDKANIPTTVLVDRRNWELLREALFAKFSVENQFNGFDLETHDADRHEGYNRLMKVDSEGFKGGNTKLMFDVNRTTITGFSIYADGDNVAFYFNLAHADEENRLSFEEVRPLLELMKAKGWFIAHKAPYELTMMMKSLGFELGERVICTLQLAVTAFNEDTYPLDKFLEPGLGEGFVRLLPEINRLFTHYDPGAELTNEQEELLYKFIAKESIATHSYNGFIKEIRYGYGLKGLTKHFLGYTQTTFEEVLGDKAHMGQLTGDEVAAYGADDAWTCVMLYRKLLDFIMKTNPAAVNTFFTQENPMIHPFSEVWREGVRINLEKVIEGQKLERAQVAQYQREIKAAIREIMGNTRAWPHVEPHEKLLKYDSKWPGNWEKYRNAVIKWAYQPDSEDDYVQCMQTKTSISSSWAAERGQRESTGPSITYYLFVRSVLYDLCGCSFQLLDGKVQSDKDAQELMKTRWIKAKGYKSTAEENADPVVRLLTLYKKLSESNTAMKLYITNYLNMTDPETHRVYPILSSQLNSRRMALEAPNLSQLAKNKDTDYVRSYFEADEADHVVVSMDWSGVELVLIGDQSGDPEFAKVFGQLPHGDLHTDTTIDLLRATEKYADLTPEVFKAMPEKKQLRTDVGKGANFGFWYSGALGTVARELGLSSDQMWAMGDAYKARFAVGEAWRVGVINQAKIDGFVQLPDGNIRYRYESTGQWAMHMEQKFGHYGDAALKFGRIAIRKIQARSGNQAVNSMIQGTCATLAKRSILRMREIIKAKGYRARFMFPVHDELVYSVHRDDAVAFLRDLWEVMCNHPDIVKTLKLDAAAAVGLNYLAYKPGKNDKGQVELDEASKVPCLPEERWGKKLTDEERQKVIDWLFEPA